MLNWVGKGSRRLVLSKLGSSVPPMSWRCLSGSASPLGEGRLEFKTKTYPSFWNRLKQQKHGLGNMALSASIAFLAVSIIKQEKELKRAIESSGQLRKQNEALTEKLENLKSVLAKSKEEEKSETDVVALLRDVLDLNGGGHAAQGQLDSPNGTDNPVHQSPPRSKFMV